MHCPHCEKQVSVFSKTLNRGGGTMTCPHCGGKIRLEIDKKLALLWFIPAVLLALVLKPLLGSWCSAPGIAVMVLLSAKLKPA
jgi:hypothetical protein